MRTLEKVLQREFDPNRRLHGYARPGMDMDREDFIDLASVSKQVPGKTPAQVTIPFARAAVHVIRIRVLFKKAWTYYTPV